MKFKFFPIIHVSYKNVLLFYNYLSIIDTQGKDIWNQFKVTTKDINFSGAISESIWINFGGFH